MKKAVSALSVLLWVLIVLIPAASLLAVYLGYWFRVSALSLGAVVAVVATMLDLVRKPTVENNILRILMATLVPFSVIHGAIYTFAYPKPWMIVCMLLTVGCCSYLSLRHGRPLFLAALSLAASVLLIFVVLFLFWLSSIFPIGSNTVVKSIDSPNGTYVAQVVDSDQGALGGNTIVQVKEKQTLHCLLFTLEKKPQRVYVGDWDTHKEMNIHWRNEDRLVINGKEYPIAS